MNFTPSAMRLVCAAVLVSQLAFAAYSAPIGHSRNFQIRFWQVEEGLPQNKATAVVQTRDGYLWIGTYSGLARFDGARFVVFNDETTAEMRSSRITSLFEAVDGTLWIGHENGAVTTFKNGGFRAEDIPAARGRKIFGISADENEDVWLLGNPGWLIRARDGLTRFADRGNAPSILGYARDARRRLWITYEGRLSALKHGQLSPVHFEHGFTNVYVQGICAASDGGLWVSHSGTVRKWNGEQWSKDLGAAPWGLSPLTSFIETAEGLLLGGTSDHGLFVSFADPGVEPLHLSRATDFKADWIMSLHEDREGTVWAGTGGNGLMSLKRSNVQTLAPPDAWRGRPVLSICPDRDDGVWIGTEGAGLYRYAHGQWENFGSDDGLANHYVWSVTQDSDGRIFAGTWGGGLFMRSDSDFKRAASLESLRAPVPALLPARSGGVWAGTGAGLLRWRAGKTNWYSSAGAMPLLDVRAIAEAPDGAVWFGMAGNGLASLKGDSIRLFRRGDGLPAEYIECLRFDRDGSLWIGTFGGGLCRYKNGKFSIINSAHGLPNNVIGHIEEDGRGYFWMSSHGGIIRAAKAALNDCADGKTTSVEFLTYGINDGLPTIECSEGLQPAGCKTGDGRLWFPTSKGLVVIDPSEVRINHLPPPMVLEGIFVDGQRLTNLSSHLTIPPGGTHFEFHYTGLSFVAPERMRFKYRIEGLEREWVDAGTKRVASYSFLPPGDYTFQAVGCNNDGVWNETGVSVEFTLLPHFWQTWWFHFAVGLFFVLAASGIVWHAARRRMRLRLEKLQREKAIERERARIAQDIHDDLGASLTRITMLSQSARAGITLPEPVTNNLDRIFRTARELTRAMDEIVWAVNPRHDRLDSLASYLSRFANEYLSVAEIRCRLDVPLQFPALHITAEVRHNLFLAFKEALHNIIQHADPTEAHIELRFEAASLHLSVRDNGRGFAVESGDRTARSPGRIEHGNGLDNMKRRLSDIGGQCEVLSEPGKGTTVKFSVPIRA